MDAAPLILALDISKTNTGVAEGRIGETPRAYSISGKDADVVGAMSKLGRWLIEKINIDRPDRIFFEAPLDAGAFRPNIDWEKQEWHSIRDPHTTLVLAKMTGIVEFICAMKSIAATPVNVGKARKEFIGHYRLKGPDAKKRVRAMCALLNWPAENNDQSDAMCVWHFGCVSTKPNLAAVITPAMHARVAPKVGNTDLEAAMFAGRRR